MSNIQHWISCTSCQGLGKKKQKKAKKNSDLSTPINSKNVFQICKICSGTGLIPTNQQPLPNTTKYPHVAIVGAGIGGIALALACLHRQIPFTLFERDSNFNDRSQGYGLTLQQASKEMKKFGIPNLNTGIVSTLHQVHNINGEIIGKWGLRNTKNISEIQNKNQNKHTNIHIARQSLRLAFLNQLGGENKILWNHKLIDFKASNKIQLTFNVNGQNKQFYTDILVGADGIRSSVRELLLTQNSNPLRYLGCIVILGICELKALNHFQHPLLDGKTVFQTANGNERMYMMPYDNENIMWQFSFPVSEIQAKKLSKNGAEILKSEVIKRANWHAPIPEILAATATNKITGYPVYDRDLLNPSQLKNAGPVTLIGDAAHPMSPFKGQGANQALLDAIQLAQKITDVYNQSSSKINIRENILEPFEIEMIDRSSIKVKKSAEAANFLHSNIVLQQGNATFGYKWDTLK